LNLKQRPKGGLLVRLYETTFIVNPQTDDASIDRQVQSVTELISTHGGKIVREDRIGTRRMMFPVGGLVQGYYASIIFEGPTTLLPELERMYKLEEPFLRYLTILYEGDPEANRAARDAWAAAFEDRDDRRGGDRDDDRGGRFRGGRRDRFDRYDRNDHGPSDRGPRPGPREPRADADRGPSRPTGGAEQSAPVARKEEL
jgi:small subunit ribosomal protein S6